jgi:hypothetical protein
MEAAAQNERYVGFDVVMNIHNGPYTRKNRRQQREE